MMLATFQDGNWVLGTAYLSKLLSFRKLFINLLGEIFVWLANLLLRHDEGSKYEVLREFEMMW